MTPAVVCPAGEITINGVIWAGSNLSASKTFASSSTSYGYYFSWDDAMVVCPEGWRLPTRQEFADLINDTYTTRTWTKGSGSSGKGLKVVPKSGYGDTSHTLSFPNGGWRTGGSGFTGTAGYDNDGFYFSSTEYDATRVYMLTSNSIQYVTDYSKLDGYPVRCVRTP